MAEQKSRARSGEKRREKIFRALKHLGAAALLLLVSFSAVLSLTQEDEGRRLWNKLNQRAALGGEDFFPAQELPGSSSCLHFIDVGQGDAVLIEQNDAYCLIDTGPEESREELLNYLKTQKIDRLNLLVITHPHADHMGNARAVLDSCQVEQVLLPKTDGVEEEQSYSMQRFTQALKEQNVPCVTGAAGMSFSLGQGKLTVVETGPGGESYNDASLMLWFEGAGLSMLDCGDAGSAEEQQLIEKTGFCGPVDVLKANHHGASASNTAGFLTVVSPRVVVVSCAENNAYGHPHASALNRFAAVGAEVYRTDADGTVVVYSTENPHELNVKTIA